MSNSKDRDLIYPPLMIAFITKNKSIQNALYTKMKNDLRYKTDIDEYVERVNEFFKKNPTYKSSGYGTSSIDVGGIIGSVIGSLISCGP